METAYEGRRIGYLRVSRPDQSPDRQIDGLKAICDEMHVEAISAVSKARPVFDRLLSGTLQTGDTLVVWDLDRASRSTRDAIDHAELLRSRGIGFRIVTLNVDTTTADGMFVYTLMAAIAQHERDRLSERTKQGLAAARRRGAQLGRPPKVSLPELRRAAKLIAEEGFARSVVAAQLGIGPWTLSRALKRNGLDTRTR